MYLNMARSRKSVLGNMEKTIAPGELRKRLKTGHSIGTSSGKSSYSIQTPSRSTPSGTIGPSNGSSSRTSSGAITSHNLIMYFGDEKYVEKNFSDESCFLDILRICKKFVDVYTVGVKVTDGDGRPLRDDGDVMFMMKEHEGVEDVAVYLDKDEKARLLSFMMPEDNSNLDSYSPIIPKVINVKISGDLIAKRKVVVEGEVIDGSEAKSSAQLFVSASDEINIPNGLKAISLPKTDKKEFLLPQEAVGNYLVAKYTPISMNEKNGDPVYVVSDSWVENCEKKNVRGRNKNRVVANLKAGEKLEIKFGKHRAIGSNHTYWSRHLGIIVKDRNICPFQVQTWDCMSQINKNHMWSAVTERFSSPDIELYKDKTLQHMGALWTSWRSRLHVKYVKPCKTKDEALKKIPEGVDAKDWEWILNKKYFTTKFQESSNRNSINRSKGKMPHRTRRKPHREMINELEEKDGNPPDLATIFFESRKKDGNIVEPESLNKYHEILETIREEPSLTELEVVEKCFGPQRHSHVFGYGGGVTRKHLQESTSSYIRELEARMREKDEENLKLKKCIENFTSLNSRMDQIEKEVRQSSSVTPPPTNQESNQGEA